MPFNFFPDRPDSDCLNKTYHSINIALSTLNRSAMLATIWFLGAYYNLASISKEKTLDRAMPNKLYWALEFSFCVIGIIESLSQFICKKHYKGFFGSRLFSGFSYTQVAFSFILRIYREINGKISSNKESLIAFILSASTGLGAGLYKYKNPTINQLKETLYLSESLPNSNAVHQAIKQENVGPHNMATTVIIKQVVKIIHRHDNNCRGVFWSIEHVLGKIAIGGGVLSILLTMVNVIDSSFANSTLARILFPFIGALLGLLVGLEECYFLTSTQHKISETLEFINSWIINFLLLADIPIFYLGMVENYSIAEKGYHLGENTEIYFVFCGILAALCASNNVIKLNKINKKIDSCLQEIFSSNLSQIFPENKVTSITIHNDKEKSQNHLQNTSIFELKQRDNKTCGIQISSNDESTKSSFYI